MPSLDTRNRRLGPWDTLGPIIDAISGLEGTNVKAVWFESISSGVSGSFAPPSGGTIVLDQWAGEVDILVSQEEDGLPTFEPVIDTEGVVITGTLDVSGNWTISGVPSGGGYDISLVYVYKVALSDFDYTKTLETATVEGINTLSFLGNLTDDISGFPENYKSESGISFVEGTRTFSITPTGDHFSVWVLGKEFIISTTQSVVISNVEGMHWVYFDEDGALQQVANPTEDQEEDLIKRNALVSYIMWDATNEAKTRFANERHGISMAGSTHFYLHEAMGFHYYEGLQAGNITADGTGNSNSDATMSLTDGTLFDEDIKFETSDTDQDLSSPAQIPVFYLDGVAGNWRKDTADNYPVKTFVGGSDRLAYNSYSAPNYGQTEIGNSRFVLTHIFVSNDIDEPVFAVQGRAEYLTANAARLGATTEVTDLDLSGLPAQEYSLLYTLIYQTSIAYSNDVSARIIKTDLGDDYIDWRHINIAGGGSGGAGDVVGPSSATDNAVARFDGATGKVIQESSAKIDDNGVLTANVFQMIERTSDPSAPTEGNSIIWMSDGTGKGDDGDILIASTAGGSTTYTTLFDKSGGDAW